MDILVHHDGAQLGPMSLEEARLAVERGELAGTDLAWTEGLTSWETLSSLLTPSGAELPASQYSPLYAPRATTSGWAIASLILGITSVVFCLSFMTGIPAIVCGHIGRAEIRRNPQRITGDSLAVAGLWTGYISTLVLPALMLLMMGGMMAVVTGGIMSELVKPGTFTPKLTYSRTWLSESEQHATTLVAACRLYAADNGGRYPATLEELHPQYLPDKTSLECPLLQEPGTTGYDYLLSGRVSPPDEEVVLTSKGKTPTGERVVAHADGRTTKERVP